MNKDSEHCIFFVMRSLLSEWVKTFCFLRALELLRCGSLYNLSSNADQRNPDLKHWLVLFSIYGSLSRQGPRYFSRQNRRRVNILLYSGFVGLVKMPEDVTLLNENKTIHRRQGLRRFFQKFFRARILYFWLNNIWRTQGRNHCCSFQNCQCLSLCAPLHSG